MADLSALFPQIRPFVPNCPEPAIEDAARHAMRQFCAESWWLRRNATFTTVADQQQYEIANTADLQLVALVAAQIAQNANSIAPLRPVSLGSMYPMPQAGLPTMYQYLPYNTIALFTTPNAAYEVTATVVVQPTDSTQTIPDELLTKWDHGLAAGALAWLQLIPGQAWSNAALAAQNAAEFRSTISNAKADVQRSYLAGAGRARPRRFLVGGGFSGSGTAGSLGVVDGYAQAVPALA